MSEQRKFVTASSRRNIWEDNPQQQEDFVRKRRKMDDGLYADADCDDDLGLEDPHLLNLIHARGGSGLGGDDVLMRDDSVKSSVNPSLKNQDATNDAGEKDPNISESTSINSNKVELTFRAINREGSGGGDVEDLSDLGFEFDGPFETVPVVDVKAGESFFLREPYTSDELKDVEYSVKCELEKALDLFDREGYEIFRDWRSKSLRPISDPKKEQEILENAMNEARIVGAPRHYQQRLYEIAVERNVIVHLGTGRGKTMIALMTIKHFSADLEKGKQTLFLVPSIALAIQQSAVLKANLSFSVKIACYASNTTAKARQELSECQILVATHGAIQDLLMHYGDVFSMEKFNLLVVDECHYAAGSHSYAVIMRRFYHSLPRSNRPRVLGLTASPLVKVKATHSDENLADMLHSLEKTLDATVVSDLTCGIGAGSADQDPIDDIDIREENLRDKQIVEKDILFTSYKDLPPIPAIEQFQVHPTRRKECQQLYQLYEDLGPLALNIYCRTLAKEISRNCFEKEKQLQFVSLITFFEQVSSRCQELCAQCPRGGRSDKLLALEELLENQIENCVDADPICLVFVERRITALALENYFRFRLKHIEKWTPAKKARKGFLNMPIPLIESLKHPSENSDSLLWSHSRSPSPRSVGMGVSPSSSAEQNHQFADADSRVSYGHLESGPDSDRKVGQEKTAVNQFEDAESDSVHHNLQGYLDQIREPVSAMKHPSSQSGDDEASIPREVCVGKEARAHRDTEHPSVSAGQFMDHDEDAVGLDLSAYYQKEEPINVGHRRLVVSKSIRCQSLVRNSTAIFRSLNIARRSVREDEEEDLRKTWLHQECRIREVLSSLRRGDINVLFATSVVEEGVDIQACDFVLAFDQLRSLRGFIQMKGRARKKNAKFFVFKDAREEANAVLSLQDAQAVQKRVEKFIASRPPPALIRSQCSFKAMVATESKSDSAELQAVIDGLYKAKHGTVDMHSAKSLVNRYILSLPLDPIVRSSKAAFLAHLPSYSDEELYLPSHLPASVRTIHLPDAFCQANRKEKEKILAMMACVRLHAYGLLSDRLLPLTKNDFQKIMLEKAKEEPRDIALKKFGCFGTSGTTSRKLHVYPMHQKNDKIKRLHKVLKTRGHSLAVVATDSLPDIPEMRLFHSTFGTVTCSLDEPFEIECNEEDFQIIVQFFKLMMDCRWRKRTKNLFFRPKDFGRISTLISPYYVGCLSTSGCLDWNEMSRLVNESKRSEAQRIAAVRSASTYSSLPRPRLWAPLYDRNFTYIIYGPSIKNCGSEFLSEKENEDVRTFQDYFKLCRNFDVDEQCQLFDAQRLWVLPFSKAQTNLKDDTPVESPKSLSTAVPTSNKVCDDLKSLYLPQDACMEVPMADPNFLLLATHLPQFLHHIQPYLTAACFVQHCEKHMPRLAKCLQHLPPEQVFQALTSKSYAEEGSYEKLEWLGDAVLKLVQTDSLLHSRDFHHWVEFLHEGDLSSLRSEMGCNKRLEAACKKLKIDHFLLTSPLGRGQWAPPTLELYRPKKQGVDDGEGEVASEEPIVGKTCADVMESLLGLVYLSCGYDDAGIAADEMQVTLTKLTNIPPEKPRTAPKRNLLVAAASFTGKRKFHRYDLVQEAFTHPTAMHPETPSYQRLEWIGDAVLCLAIREWIYTRFPTATVGQMVQMEASLVTNETLAFLSIKHGLLKTLNHCDQTLPARIEQYDWSTQELQRGLWGTDPPKVAADVVEALFGACYLDGGFNEGVEIVLRVLSPMMKVLERIYAERDHNNLMMHPKKAIQEMGGSLLVMKVLREDEFAVMYPKETPVWLGKRWGHANREGQKFIGYVDCLGLIVVSVADVSSEVAGNRACAFAVGMFRSNPKLLQRLQGARTMVESTATIESNKGSGLVDESNPTESGHDGPECDIAKAQKRTSVQSRFKEDDAAEKVVRSVLESVLD